MESPSSRPTSTVKGLVKRKSNFAPRVGFAYEVTPKLVTRGGFGMFYNSFENQGYGPNIGENYPFVYNFDYTPQASGSLQSVAPVSTNTPYSGCPHRPRIPGGAATLESGFSCFAFDPAVVNGLASVCRASSLTIRPPHVEREPDAAIFGDATRLRCRPHTCSPMACIFRPAWAPTT